MKRPHRNAKPDATSEVSRIAEVAADWRARCDAGLAPDLETDFAAWLESDPRHAEVFAQMDATWAILDRASEVSPDVLAPPATALAKPSTIWRRSARVIWIGTAMGAAAAAALMFLASRGAAGDNFVDAAVVGPDLVKRVNLPDGSVVRLNANSAITVRFSRGERHVLLERGEASFDVAKNPHRPFVVTSAGVDIRAVGTAFNVARRTKAVEVLVTEGKVSVDDATRGGSLLISPEVSPAAPRHSHLTAGEKVTIPVQDQAPPGNAAPVVVDAPAMAAALAWQERKLEFNSEPLIQIAAEFNRYNQHKLVIAGAALGNQRFAGSFRADDPETFVRLIATRSGVLVEQKPNETVIRMAK